MNLSGLSKIAFAFIFFVATGWMFTASAQQSPPPPPVAPLTVPPAAPIMPPPAPGAPTSPAATSPAPRAPSQTQAATPAAQPPAADPKDVATMDAIITALYDVISGPAGQKRNWDRFRSLFVPGARLIPTGRRPTGEAVARVRTPEDYIQGSGPVLERDGFFEKQVSLRVEKFANIAHIFSTYEARRKADEEKPFLRGINSIQLMNDGKRWWIVTVFWQAEDADNPLPAEYLRTRN